MLAVLDAGQHRLASIPARAGIGLKPEHMTAIMQSLPDIGWFEVHAENYMGAGGPPHRFLEWVRERYPLSIHGVGLSLGGAGALEKAHHNVYVSAANHRFDADAYLGDFAMEHVREIHLAGHFEAEPDEDERLLIDAHDSPVREAVWALYSRALQRSGPLATLIEWDNDIPDFETLQSEADKAERLLKAQGRQDHARLY